MSESLLLSGAVLASIAIATLWASVISGRSAGTVRIALALAAFASAWALCFLLARLHAPTWAGLCGGASVVVSLFAVIAAAQLSLPNGRGSGPDDAGGGGGNRPPPDRPPDGDGPADPSWWPQFERDLARYLAEQPRQAPKSPAVAPNEPVRSARISSSWMDAGAT